MTIAIPIIVVALVLAWVFRPKKDTIQARRAAILATTVPLVALFVAALIVQAMQNSTGVSDISNALFISGLCLTGAAILALLGFVYRRKDETARGIGFGLTVMVILSMVEFVSLEAMAGL
jgi:hypothetical protein